MKNQFERLVIHLQDNFQPDDLKFRPLPRSGKNNLRSRAFAAGAALAITHYAVANEILFPSRVRLTRRRSPAAAPACAPAYCRTTPGTPG